MVKVHCVKASRRGPFQSLIRSPIRRFALELPSMSRGVESARLVGQLRSIVQPAAALDASLGSIGDESPAPLWLEAPLKPSSR